MNFKEELMMKNVNRVLKGLLMSVSALAVGFLAMSLPFQLFSELSDTAMEIVFIGEIMIYLTIGMIFLIVKEKKNRQREKQNERHLKRQEKIKKVQEDWYNLAA